MRVAIDARRLQDRPLFGVGRGLANLIPHLASQAEVTLLFDRRRPTPAIAGCRQVALFGWGPLPEPAWLQFSAGWWSRRTPVVFHGPYNAVPYASRHPRVVTLHDLAWEEHGEDYPSRSRQLAIRTQARWSARHSDVVLTVSQYTRTRIIEQYGIQPDRVLVSPNAVDPVFTPDRAGQWASDIPYVVALGGARRRGLEVAVAAWRIARMQSGSKFKLVVVGNREPIQDPDIIDVGVVDDETWAAILAGGTAFCFPTRYEGFGMPALEAAASGVPVVCPRVTALPEVLGTAAEWAESASVEHMAAALRKVLEDHGRREELTAAGIAQAAALPGWADSARIILEAYRLAAA